MVKCTAAILLSYGGLISLRETKDLASVRMSVSPLDDEEDLNYLIVNIPKWKSEGENELSDQRCVCDWIKKIQNYNARY